MVRYCIVEILANSWTTPTTPRFTHKKSSLTDSCLGPDHCLIPMTFPTYCIFSCCNCTAIFPSVTTLMISFPSAPMTAAVKPVNSSSLIVVKHAHVIVLVHTLFVPLPMFLANGYRRRGRLYSFPSSVFFFLFKTHLPSKLPNITFVITLSCCLFSFLEVLVTICLCNLLFVFFLIVYRMLCNSITHLFL